MFPKDLTESQKLRMQSKTSKKKSNNPIHPLNNRCWELKDCSKRRDFMVPRTLVVTVPVLMSFITNTNPLFSRSIYRQKNCKDPNASYNKPDTTQYDRRKPTYTTREPHIPRQRTRKQGKDEKLSNISNPQDNEWLLKKLPLTICLDPSSARSLIPEAHFKYPS
jgi:hypothetical protein